MTVIDADAHVVETDRTWEYVEGPERTLAPIAVHPTGAMSDTEYWLIDGQARPRGSNVSDLFPKESRELLDVQSRLRHMDEMGLDIQVLFPSMLQAYTDRPEVELAFCRSYNRWLADVCGQSDGRLRWAAILPLMSMDQALSELRFARDHGACAIFIRSIEAGDRQVSEPYFFPMYEEAMKLDVPVCVHASFGSSTFGNLFPVVGKSTAAFPKFQLPVVCAFHELVLNEVPQKFPTLRFGFVETGAQWIPYVMHHLLKRPGFTHLTGPELMRRDRLYVACEADEDLPYILRHSGEDHLVIGTDYGHADPHMDYDAVQSLRARPDVEPRVVEKILDANARSLYAI